MTCEAFQPSLEPTIHVTHFVHADLKALSVCGSVYTFEKVYTLLKKVYTLLPKSVYTFGQKCIHFLKSVYTFVQKCIHFLKSVYCIHFWTEVYALFLKVYTLL